MKKYLFLGLLIISGCGTEGIINTPEDDYVNLSDAKWFFGSGGPPSTDGVDGDLYLKTSDSTVFVKVDGAWKTVATIKGEKGDPGNPGTEMTCWTHTITSSEITYVSKYPSGFYMITYCDSRINQCDWIDIWETTGTGYWLRQVPTYDSELEIWYDMAYIYDKAIVFYLPSSFNVNGLSLMIFHTEPKIVSSGKAFQFNAAKYFRDLTINKQ